MKESRILGDYQLVKQIGQGALGALYLAEHRFMKKPFALKLLPEDLCSDRGFIQRFEEEVSQLATLDHPHIVKIHNISYDQGCYFLVTDCIVDEVGENTNLAQYLQSRGNKLSEDEVYRILSQIASALDYAHGVKGKGIAHRGIKLNNILVSKGEGGIDLSLSDYGLSKVVGTATFLTRAYKIVAESLELGASLHTGTVDSQKISPLHASFLQSYLFLAPEQKKFDHPIGNQADTYALGILAYYLLTGEFPEGYFEMPSAKRLGLKYGWDELIRQFLAANALKRPSEHVAILEQVKGKVLSFEHLAVAKITHKEVEALRPVFHTAHLERPVHDQDPATTIQVDTAVKKYTPEQKEERNIEPLLTEMAIVEGGAFTRGSVEGSRDEMPRHEITVDSFAIDIHPVTNEQFVRFLEAMGGVKDSNHNDIIRLKDSRINSSKGKFSIESGYLKHPVVGVTWYGAVAYAKWVGKRLPTEAEWEITAKGGQENPLYATGEEIEKTQANFFSFDTTAVKSYPPNGYGVFDLAGNVYEWCQDWYGYNYYEASVQEPFNPMGPLQGVYRVLRGGCWKSLKEDLRCSKRHRNNPGTVNSTYGFRCAADVQ